MEITCDSKRNFEGCKIARQLKPITSLPSTTHLKVDATNGKVTLRVSNLDQTILYDLKGNIKESGNCFLPMKPTTQFAQFTKSNLGIKADSKDSTSLYVIGDDIQHRTTTKFYSMNLNDIPIPDIGEATITFPQDIQHRMSYALQCVATEDNRPILTGVCFDYSDNLLQMVSADGFRLIVVNTPMSHDKPFRIIIPSQAISIVSRYMRGIICFGFNDQRAWFVNDEMTIITQLIKGTYPAYDSFIPTQKPEWVVTFSAPLFQQCLNQMPNEILNIVRLTHDDNLFKLAVRSKEYQDYEAFIPAAIVGTGKSAFNRNYLLTASKIFSEMTLEITTPTSPMKILGDLDGVMLLIMPMLVQW